MANSNTARRPRAKRPTVAARAKLTSTNINPQEAARKLAAETVILDLTVKLPSYKRRMDPKDVMAADDAADTKLLHMEKSLIDKAALTDLGSNHSRFKGWLEARSVTCRMLRGGMYLIPLALIGEVDEQLQVFIRERKALVEKLLEKYDEYRADAERRLGKHFDPDEYPSKERLRAGYEVRGRWLSFNVPAALEDLNSELYERERKRVEAEWATAAEDIRTALREAFAGLVENAALRLSSPEDGKAKGFRDSVVTKMQEFLRTFAARDLTNDTALAELAERASDLLNGIEPEKLRSNDSARERIATGMGEIKAALVETQLVPRTRKFAKGEDLV